MKIDVTIKPNSTKGPLVEPQADGSLIVYVREIASDGQANQALIKLLANHFGTSKTRIAILRGQSSRRKIISIDK